MKIYELNGGRLNITKSECFAEATKEELRVLLALIEGSFNYSDETELARAAKTTKSRVISALALFESEGIIRPYEAAGISFEYGDCGEERSAREVARDIRDEGLAGVIEECSAILNKDTLTTGETKLLVELYTDEGLSEEYIVTLASYLMSTKKNGCSVRSVYSQAKELKKKGIESSEALDAYIKERQRDNPHYQSFRAFFKIWLRPLSEHECELALKWFDSFGYTEPIISKAYDASIQASNGQGYSLSYIDTVLTKWHDAGCATVEDCIAFSDTYKAKLAAEASTSGAKHNIQQRRKEKTAEVPKYGNFNIEEAFAAALERSYNDED